MAIRASSLFNQTVNGGVKIRIKKPLSNGAREIRDAILRDHFGFTDNDIKELDAQMPGKFEIVKEGTN